MPSQEPKAFTVPRDFLADDGPEATATKLDFTALNLPEYSSLYAVVIDNALTAAECQQLTTLAEASAGGFWERAMVNIGNNQQRMITDVRNCNRIIWDTPEVVGRIWQRVRRHVEADIGRIENQPHVTGYGPVKRKEVAVLSRLNECMRFLQYGSGEYFREHCDGQYRTPDDKEFSLFTLHLYLNESDAGNKLEGGATRFFDPGFSTKDARFYDVEPKIGRVLIFQHRGLLHSGEEVYGGLKLTLRTDIMYRNLGKDE